MLGGGPAPVPTGTRDLSMASTPSRLTGGPYSRERVLGLVEPGAGPLCNSSQNVTRREELRVIIPHLLAGGNELQREGCAGESGEKDPYDTEQDTANSASPELEEEKEH